MPTSALLWLNAVPLMAMSAMSALACGTNPRDDSQQPRVTVSQPAPGDMFVIAWEPVGAQLVRVYRGAVAGDGYGPNLIWSIAASGKNSLVSGIRYGAPPSGGTTDVPPSPLVVGETYTVQVTRQDPEGTGDGFTNTSHRYVGTATITMR